MKQHIVILLIIFAAIQSRGQSDLILFDKNSFVLSSDYKSKLDLLVDDIKQVNGIEEISLIGHTDTDADNAYNKTLSFNRAKAVKDYLVLKGLKNKIHIDSKGETETLNNNETEEEKAKNRRVEIIRNYSKKNEAFANFKKDYQVFIINIKRDTLIQCKGGASIKIEKNVFETNDISSPVIIKVQEYNSKKDFVLSNLTTQDVNNEQLESRGMLNIEAYQNDKKVELKEGKEIGITFKDRKINDSTEMFNGITHNEEIVWDKVTDKKSLTGLMGKSTTTVNGDVTYFSKWEYKEINGEMFKVIETTTNGKTTYDTVSVESEKVTRDLVLNTKKLGWINCDKFYKDNSPKIDVIVKYSGLFVPSVVAVFENINSVLPYSYREDDKLIFKNIPTNQNIVFIGLFKSKNNSKILFAQKKTKSKDGLIEIITFDELTADEVENKINAL